MRAKARWRDPALGTPRQLDLAQGRLRCFEAGSGPPIVFIHGGFVNANLWRKVVPKLAPGFHCVSLDLPFGSHDLPMKPDADLSERGILNLIVDAIEALGLGDVTLVGMDTGGAICQLLVTQRPERIGRLVLTSCDYRDNAPPRIFWHVKLLPYLGPLAPLLFAPMRLRVVRRLPNAFGWLTNRPVERAVEDTWVLPGLEDGDVRRDLNKFIQVLDKRRLNEAADKLGTFDRPALIAWSRDDRVFPPEHAERLASELPNARLEFIEGARTLSMEDQPERLAELIAGFVREPGKAAVGSSGAERRPRSRRLTGLAVALMTLLGLAWMGSANTVRADASRPIGETKVLASVPYPGHPGGIVVDGKTAYVDTFNPVDRAGDDYDAIFTYDLATGTLRADRPNPIKVPRMMSPAVMGLAAMALDAQGRLYVADMNGRILRVNPETGAQADYATFPTNSMTSLTAMPDGIAFDKAGNLYVTDGSASVIWRVPPGGGVAKAWFVDPALPSAWASGLDGAAVDPSDKYLYFTEGYGSATGVYRLPLDRPEIPALELVHLYPPPQVKLDARDSEIHGVFGVSAMAFGSSGKLYVALLGANQVSVLRSDGTEERRFPSERNPEQAGLYDDPLFPAFDGTGSLLLTNLAIWAPQRSSVLEAWVNDKGFPLVRPAIP